MGSQKHFTAGFLSYLIWGFVPVLLRLVTAYDDFEIILYRILGAALIMMIVLGFAGRLHAIELVRLFQRSRRDFATMLVLSVIGGLLLAVNWVAYVYVVNHISINAASFAYLILPIATAFLAYMILKESLTLWRWIGIVISGISCVLMAQIDLTQTLYIAAITFSYAFYLISQRRNTFVSRRLSLGIQMTLGFALMLIFNPAPFAPASLDGYFVVVVGALAAVFTVLPLMLNLYALNGMESSQLAFLIYVNPIVAFLTAVIWYGEVLSWVAAIAYTLMAIAIVIFNWDILGKIFSRVRKTAVEAIS
jgi:chloramphenicol-sensitive protein RarD